MNQRAGACCKTSKGLDNDGQTLLRTRFASPLGAPSPAAKNVLTLRLHVSGAQTCRASSCASNPIRSLQVALSITTATWWMSTVVRSPSSRFQPVLLLASAAGRVLGSSMGSSEAELASAPRKPWAWLLRHVFQADVSECRVCGGAVRWVEVATSTEAVARVLGGRRPQAPRAPPPGQLLLPFA